MTIDLSIARRMSGGREVIGAEVLLIDQDKRVQQGMTQLLSEANLNVTCASTPEQGLELIDKQFFSVAIVDLDTPTPGAGLGTTAAIKERSPTSMVVILTPRKSFDDTVSAIRTGAIDVVLKAPDSVPYLKERIVEAAARSVDTREVTSVLAEVQKVHQEFLQLFMDAERRALDAADRLSGRDPDRAVMIDELHVLVVDANPNLADALRGHGATGYVFEKALSGGQALDLVGSRQFHYVMVASDLYDLPSSMVVRSIKAQSPESVVLAYSGPGPGGKVEVVDTARTSMVIPSFTSANQLIERLDELTEAFRAKSRERRYTQAFRERHYDFLRRYINLKAKIDRALSGGPAEE